MEIVAIFLLLFVLIFTVISAIVEDCASAKFLRENPQRYHIRKRRKSVNRS